MELKTKIGITAIGLVGAASVAGRIIGQNQIVTCSACKKQAKRKDFDFYKFNSLDEDCLVVKDAIRSATPLCKKCGPLYNKAIEITKIKADSIETFPTTYKGNRYQKQVVGKIPMPIESAYFYKDKDIALKELKIIAAGMCSDVITDVHYDYNQQQDGNYIYKIWQAKGTAWTSEDAMIDNGDDDNAFREYFAIKHP